MSDLLYTRLADSYLDQQGPYVHDFGKLIDRRQAIILLDYLQDVILKRLATDPWDLARKEGR